MPTATIDAIIPDQTNDPILNVNGVCKKLTITDGVLVLDNGFDLTTYGDVAIGTGTSVGILTVANNGSEITCGGSWTRGTNGIFVHGSSTVNFNSGVGSATIDNRSSSFNNVVFDSSATTFYLTFSSASTINVEGNFEILSGNVTPNTNNYTLNIGGNFNNQDIFTPSGGGIGAGTVVFNAAADQTITNGNFHHLTISGSNTKYTTGACAIVGNTTVNSTLRANAGSSARASVASKCWK